MKLNVANVQLSCAIKGCTHVEKLGVALDRHHVRSQKLFVYEFEYRRSRKWRRFKARYEQFLDEDICRICRLHHDQVHRIYRGIVQQHTIKLGKRVGLFSWRQAEILMQDLERNFWKFVKEEEQRLARVA